VKRFSLFIYCLLIAGFLAACSDSAPEPTAMLATDTATVTPSPSATIVWFPPTETATVVPTRIIEPTAQMRPGLGQIIVSDAFSDGSLWLTGSYSAGNIAAVDQSLTLAIQQPRAFLQSFLSQPAVDQFDLQVDVNVSLCRAEDHYGLLIRAASEWDYYRFLVNCQGYARAERIRNSQTTLMQDWTWAGVIPGAPVKNSLEVWAVDKEMRFFVNGFYVFSVTDPVFTSGQVGVFARSAGENAMTVNFTEMVIRAINRSELLETATATP
jgi:hypothetical protein